MSHGKREFEGDITTIAERIKMGQDQEPEQSLTNNDFLNQIVEDYGIHSLGGRVYEIESKGVKHQGSLARMFEILRDENTSPT